jgi:lysophospholipase L1-like esterase
MSATKGWMRSIRLLGCLTAVALLGTALVASSAGAMKTPLKPTKYIALGDSLSFGYKAATLKANAEANKAHCEAGVTAAEKGETELAYAEKALCEPASTFEGGFVGYFAKKESKPEKEAGNELQTVNLGCPGETSDGLIGHLLGGTPEAEYNPCAYHNSLPSQGFPLKVEYGHTTSQLEALLGQIAASKEEGGTPISVISLQIGSNDELHALGACENGLYLEAHGFKSIIECAEHEAGPEGYLYEGGLIKHILTNIGTTIGVIREAGYTGRIIVQGFYNPFGTLLEGSDKLVEVLNSNLEGLIVGKSFGPNLSLAKPYTLVNPSGPLYKEGETAKEHAKLVKKENKTICKYTEMCPGEIPLPSGDIHPTEKGYKAMGKQFVQVFGEAPLS